MTRLASSLLAFCLATAAQAQFASLLANPLPWQRYYLPLTGILCLYAALGLQTLMRALANLASQSRA